MGEAAHGSGGLIAPLNHNGRAVPILLHGVAPLRGCLPVRFSENVCDLPRFEGAGGFMILSVSCPACRVSNGAIP